MIVLKSYNTCTHTQIHTHTHAHTIHAYTHAHMLTHMHSAHAQSGIKKSLADKPIHVIALHSS